MITILKKTTMKPLRGLMGLLLGALLLSQPAMAGGDADLNSGDTAWMLVSALLVLMMCLPGLALFYGGLVRSKNVLSIFVQCFAMAGVMSLLWVVFGYAVATGDTQGGIIGW
ncbi:MAG: ammonia channel protein, partial [Akkermansiaceae bacterium]